MVMKDKNTEIVFILDRSGSMCGLEEDTIGGFNAFLKKQKKCEGKGTVTAVLFDERISVLYDHADLDTVAAMGENDYQPGGCTALLDAVGFTIIRIRQAHETMPAKQRPDHTIFVITTDGLENSSREYTYESVHRMIEKTKEEGWEYLFLGANIDAVREASRFGIGADRAVRFENDGEGIAANYEAISDAVMEMRTCASIDEGWKEKIEKNYKKHHKTQE
jgi:hypothetical protein